MAFERRKPKVNNPYYDVCSRTYTVATERSPMVSGRDVAGGSFFLPGCFPPPPSSSSHLVYINRPKGLDAGEVYTLRHLWGHVIHTAGKFADEVSSVFNEFSSTSVPIILWKYNLRVFFLYFFLSPSFISFHFFIYLPFPSSNPFMVFHTWPLIERVPRALSLGIKGSWREADHSPPSTVEVRDDGAIPPVPHTSSCHVAWLIKHREFTFTLLIFCFSFLFHSFFFAFSVSFLFSVHFHSRDSLSVFLFYIITISLIFSFIFHFLSRSRLSPFTFFHFISIWKGSSGSGLENRTLTALGIFYCGENIVNTKMA
jgi:hypothetical protein